jgi:hypothetical protein
MRSGQLKLNSDLADFAALAVAIIFIQVEKDTMNTTTETG